VTRAIWDCILGEFRCVKANCVLHNFMRMDTRTRRGSAARRRVPEEKSAALLDVARMGSNNAAREAIPVQRRSSSPTSLKRVVFTGNTIDYTMHNQILF
jgi:hypothetical protein